MKREYLLQYLGLAILLGLMSIAPIRRMLGNQTILNLGLDLRGGVSVLIECLKPEGRDLTPDDVNGVITVMTRRLDPEGVKEITIQRQGDKYVSVEIPGEKNVDKIRRQIEKFAKLEFVDPKKKPLDEGSDATGYEVVVSGEHLQSAQISFSQQTGRPSISFNLDKEGSKQFFDFTRKNVKYYLAIALDKKVLSCPQIQGPISGSVEITGDFSLEEAQEMVNLLNAGRLPVGVRMAEINSIGPTLGKETIRVSVLAGAAGLIVVLLFMVGYYRVLGLIADAALVIYTTLFVFLLSQSFIDLTLTLPGIAGFILSIGMAVDGNVIIFERIKEELAIGRSLKAGVEAGFKNALTAIVDSNVTTLIGAVILYSVGTGPVKGFAVTLGWGIALSMFSSIVVTKLLLLSMLNIPAMQNLKLYGVKPQEA